MSRISFAPSRLLPYALAAAVLLAGAIGAAWQSSSRAEEGVLAPAPALDQPLAAGQSQTAVLAGGCFWGVQGGCARADTSRSASPANRRRRPKAADRRSFSTG